MEVILYLAQTVNGYIAEKNDNVPWTDIWATYYSEIKKAKNIIVGRRTYEIMKRSGEVKKCGDPFVVVITKSKPSKAGGVKTIFVQSPKQALSVVRAKGFRKTFVGGGSKTAGSFMKLGLINQLYIDIEPFVFGTGIPLLSEMKFESKLKLVKIKRLYIDV